MGLVKKPDTKINVLKYVSLLYLNNNFKERKIY